MNTTSEQRPEELLPMIYEELRALARRKMAGERTGQTLQATALVHEAYLRLVSGGDARWKNRRYFFASAAEAMRRILIERARARQSQKRGSGVEPVDIEELEIAAPIPANELLALNAALERFEVAHPEKAELVKLKFFVGLPTAEAAAALGISEATAKRYWAFSRAWLYREVHKDGADL